MKPYYIAFDVEAGGIEHDRTILSAYFSILDQQLNPLDELELFLKPPKDKPYVVDAEGMAVNRIDLVEHHKKAIYPGDAGQILRPFLIKHFEAKGERLTVLGHGAHHDVEWIVGQILRRTLWDTYVSWRHINTASIAIFLVQLGLMSDKGAGSLGSIASFFGIEESGFHDAKVDTRITVEVYRRMLKLVSDLEHRKATDLAKEHLGW